MRRTLRQELRRWRTDAGLTQRDVAERLVWSPSKVIRIESGESGISVTDLRAIARLFGVPEGPQLDQLAELAKSSRRQPFGEFKDLLPKDTIRFFDAEGSASLIRSVQTVLVPGLLQTEDYSRALFASAETDSGRIDRIIAARKKRQQLLARDTPPEIFVILDEAVLHRTVGGPEVMRQQLESLVTLAEQPRISIQVMPFDRGVYPGLTGAFNYLEFAHHTDPDVVFLDGVRGAVSWIDDPATVADYQESFLAMEDQAAARKEFASYVERALSSF